ncbi:MAG: tetratricopeptide (TPR) repeat protein [Gammaproteobacteria bacterium]|jgi:tetratricopeptide (TPR) repeat protein
MTQLDTRQAESADKYLEIKSLLSSGRIEDAVDTARKSLQQFSFDKELLYLLAVALRYQGKFDDALSSLNTLVKIDQDYARAWQEIGHDNRQLKKIADAIQAYEKAISLNPALYASWDVLRDLYKLVERSDLAENAEMEFQRLKELPQELASALSLFHQGRLYKAEQLCRYFLNVNPTHVEGMRLLAGIGIKLHILDDAQFLLESCLEFEPKNPGVRIDYIDVLHRRQKYDLALEQASLLLDRESENQNYKLILANQTFAAGEYDSALELYDEVIASFPNSPALYVLYGHALKTVGKSSAAIEAYKKAYELKPDHGDAWWSLANLKTYRFLDKEIEVMERSESNPATMATDQIHLCFALGKAYEDRKIFETSFQYYKKSNEQHLINSQYRAENTSLAVEKQIQVCSEQLMQEKRGFGCDQPDPIFIVGLPRAGSTLLEQILASHSQIDGTMELHNILALAHRLMGRHKKGDNPKYPEVLKNLSAEQLQKFGEEYIRDTRYLRGEGKFFIDKMPNNFMHLGLIHLILPNAKIIDARREPVACCFSNYKQLFGEGQEFTYGLIEIGRYYNDYVRLMTHWNKVIPDNIFLVQHETLIQNIEESIRQILDFLELSYEPSCLEFYKTERAIRTPSSEQVRQPVSTSGMDQWKNFEPWLGDLFNVLEEK